ncbi:hypothetical protein [uncultured Methylobacterium sp.]|uniref:hypothetical protein n=1 Tax=uncultured Methylobacterium sp. TaxID=157278 RepID=UPI002626E419|nr:hypothetical protein [uncultured Methylobacterium sp.]
MAANNASAASELVRMHMGQVFDQATQRLQSGANQASGAKFSAALVGQGAEAASMEAAVRFLRSSSFKGRPMPSAASAGIGSSCFG